MFCEVDTTVVAESQKATNWAEIIAPTALPDATLTVKGVLQLASVAEAIAGVNTEKAIVPATLKGYNSANNVASEFTVSGTTAQLTANHSWNTSEVSVSCFKLTGSGTPKEEIDAEVRVTNANTVTAEINMPTPGFTWEVVVIGVNKA